MLLSDHDLAQFLSFREQAEDSAGVYEQYAPAKLFRALAELVQKTMHGFSGVDRIQDDAFQLCDLP